MKTAALLIAFAASPQFSGIDANAQSYPVKSIRMIVPFAPGGAADLIGRILAQKLSDGLGQPVFVDNRTGASGNIGAEAVARAPADGYTILLGALASHSINYTLERTILRYDLKRDLEPVAIVASVPYVFVTHPSVPAPSLQEFIALAKANPGHFTYGSSGAGSPQRLAAEKFKLQAGVDMLHVPYKGGSAQVIADLVGGHILAAFELMPAALPYVNAGKLRPLAVTTAEPVPMLPGVPTMAGAGLSGFEMSSTFGILAPAGTPKHIVERLNGELGKIIQLPDVREKLMQQGAFSTSTTPEQASQRIHAEIAMWADVIRNANLRPE